MEHDQVVRYIVAERDKIYAYTWAIVRDDHLADDIVQEVAILAISKCDEINGPSHLPAWVRVAARNRALYHMRENSRGPQVVDAEVLELMETDWKTYESTPCSSITAALRNCLKQLSPYARKLVELRYVDGLRPAEIAIQIDRNVNTVYVAMTRTHKQLADCVTRSVEAGGESDD